MSNIISQIYNSRKILLEQLKERGFDIDDYNHFSFNEIRMMIWNFGELLEITCQSDNIKSRIEHGRRI